ncbi:hypothetical protein PM082_023151 [Marasmius tenuissimus]|nr:hypothetical protein PM082_023151 [Marasmius tenuissimus]
MRRIICSTLLLSSLSETSSNTNSVRLISVTRSSSGAKHNPEHTFSIIRGPGARTDKVPVITMLRSSLPKRQDFFGNLTPMYTHSHKDPYGRGVGQKLEDSVLLSPFVFSIERESLRFRYVLSGTTDCQTRRTALGLLFCSQRHKRTNNLRVSSVFLRIGRTISHLYRLKDVFEFRD